MNRPTTPSLSIRRAGERLLIGRFRVEVENGAVVSVEALDGQAQSVTAFITPEAVPTLAEILERVAEARRQNAYEVTLSTDPVDGHPTMVSIDWDFNTIDEEECYAISEYAPSRRNPREALARSPLPYAGGTHQRQEHVGMVSERGDLRREVGRS